MYLHDAHRDAGALEKVSASDVLIVTGSAAEGVAEFIIFSAKSVCRLMLLEAAHTSDASFDSATVLSKWLVQVDARPVTDAAAQCQADRTRVRIMPIDCHPGGGGEGRDIPSAARPGAWDLLRLGLHQAPGAKPDRGRLTAGLTSDKPRMIVCPHLGWTFGSVLDPGNPAATTREIASTHFAEYSRYCGMDRFAATRELELASRCVVETGTATLYRALSNVTDEPVLKRIASLIAADEVRHYKHFYRFFQRYHERERTNRLAIARTLWQRMTEVDDEDGFIAFKHVFVVSNPGAEFQIPRARASALRSFGDGSCVTRDNTTSRVL
jgi:hypothetical protein